MSIGASLPGGNDNYGSGSKTGGGGGYGWYDPRGWVSGTKVTVGSGGGSVTKTVSGVEFTYNWGTKDWRADPQAAANKGISSVIAGPPPQKAGLEPQLALYAVVGAVILYFMVKK